MINTSSTLRISCVRKQISDVSEILTAMPGENLGCSHDGKYYRYFYNKNGHQYYISKKDRQTAVLLAEKKYYEALLEDLKNEEKLLAMYQNLNQDKRGRCEELMDDDGISRLLAESRSVIENKNFLLTEEIKEWMAEDYDRNEKYPEKLIHKGMSGNYLRSKSEEMIDTILYQLSIPYRYECAAYLGDCKLYPDFTLRHPITGEVTYWEHFGMMDDVQYVEDYSRKMNTYIMNGVIPSIGLIATYETKFCPLTFEKVRRVAEEWLQS